MRDIVIAVWISLAIAGGAARAAEFEGPGKKKVDPVRALLGPTEGDLDDIAAAVRRQRFWAGDPGSTGAAPCAGCHADVAAQWTQSAHRFASFNNPYYTVSVEAFRKERGLKESRFCGGCHDPLLVATGAIDKPVTENVREGRLAQSGIVCLVCHSIDTTSLDGNGEYHVTLAEVPTERPYHKQRLRTPLLGEPRLCAGCHKVGLTEEVTHDRWLRGQDDYDPWQASAASGNGAGSLWRPPRASRCQDCHMPLEPARLEDAGAHVYPPDIAGSKPGVKMIRSHRFVAANTALARLRGDEDMVKRTEEFLQNKVSLDLGWIDDRHVDVVMRSRGVGHRFPSGTMDSNEVWVEVEAMDARGRVIARSGGLDRRGDLDIDAHLVRVQMVDGEGKPLERRDPQHGRGIAWDTALGPSDPLATRFAVPDGTASVRARLLYRKFPPSYARLACAEIRDPVVKNRCIDIPIVEMARAEEPRRPKNDIPAVCNDGKETPINGPFDPEIFRRVLEHGVALADGLAEQAEEALPYLICAQRLAPRRPEPALGRARLALLLGQVDEAVKCSQDALAVAPDHPAALFVESRALYQAYRFAESRPAAEKLIKILPEDRNALALVARVRGINGDARGALEAADRLLAVDPGLEEAHYQRSLALRELGRSKEADVAEVHYLKYRVATEVDLDLRQKFRTHFPGRATEDQPVHTHALKPVAH